MRAVPRSTVIPGMYTLVTSVLFSVTVSVFLKLARRCRIHIDQAIAVNYVTASMLCLVLLRPTWGAVQAIPATAWIILALLGVLLPSVFLVMAAAVRQAGIVRSDTAQRLSLLLPIMAAFLVFHEALSGRKALGIVLALCALACLLSRPASQQHAPDPGKTARSPAPTAAHAQAQAPAQAPASGPHPPTTRLAWLTLLGVWLGYGFIDILFKQMARLGAGFVSSLMASFVLAMILMFLWLVLARRTIWSARSLASGVLLGSLNFGNIYFYIRAHQTFPDNPTLVFAAMNIGVISVGTLVGAGVFRERLSAWHIAGIALALAAIVSLLPH